MPAIPSTSARQPSMANRLRSQDMAALQRALESQRAAARAAQERSKELQQALDSERSAGRALKREAAAHERSVREEEGRKYAALIDQLKNKLELAQSEAVAAEKENVTRTLITQFQRELHAREEEWRRETKKQLDALQDQLRETQQREAEAVTPKSQTEALVHSLHADFHRTLRQKQEEWRKDTNNQMEALTNQLRDLQRMYTDTCNKLTITTNEAETIPKLRQEIQTLKQHNKELEEKVQLLAEAERRKVEEFRALHEENSLHISQMQKTARKEAFQLLEEMKSKDRTIAHLRKEYDVLVTRLASPSTSPQALLGSESSLRVGESARGYSKKPKSLQLPLDWNKRIRAQEERKPPDPPDDISTENTSDVFNSVLVENWTKKVGVETLYQLLLEEHQELQMTHHNTLARLREEERIRSQLEGKLRSSRESSIDGDNVINLALAEQIQVLQERQTELQTEVQDLREQNDLLEFRILELDDGGCTNSCTVFHFKSPSSRSPDDDVSDSGVMSLTTSEDISEADFQDYKMEPNNRDVKTKLSQLCQSLENVSDRISVQQALSLLRHYEARIENLEATLAAMCQEAAQSKPYDQSPSSNSEHTKSPSRIIATVLPFTDLSATHHSKELKDDIPLKRLLRDQDCMQESGIFDDGGFLGCVVHSATQTDWTVDPSPGDLGAEIRKLTQIRERIEEKGGNKRLLKTPENDPQFLTHASLKELLFYRDRVQMLEEKIAIYESRGDEQTRLLAVRLEKEVLLAAQLKHLQNTLRHLKEENRFLEEEKCEYEEAENDTRLRCQKLEVKLSALGEKKSDLQVQLQQNARTLANLRSNLAEEERKRNEARQYAVKLEVLVNRFEQQHFEMEEKEMEIRYRLHTLEKVVPAMVIYYMWRLLNTFRPFTFYETGQTQTTSSVSDSSIFVPNTKKEITMSRSEHNSRKLQDSFKTFLDETDRILSFSKDASEPFSSGHNSSDSQFLIIEGLTDKCHYLEEKVKELELKEKVYQETLQNGDELFNRKEKDYKHLLKAQEDELCQKRKELERAEAQLRKFSSMVQQESHLQDRISQLDSQVSTLQELLVKRDREKKVLEGEKKNLSAELDEALNNIESFKKTIEKPLKDEIELLKQQEKDLLGDLDKLEQDKNEEEEMHRKLVKELRKINEFACRQLDESDVTISELKEEVQTLEREVGDLRAALRYERDQNERQIIRVSAELEAKEQQLRSYHGSHSSVESLHQELLQADVDSSLVCLAEVPVDHTSISDSSASNGPSSFSLHRTVICPNCKTAFPLEHSHVFNSEPNSVQLSKMGQSNNLLLLR